MRETRRLRGRHVLTREDVLAARDFPDAIARCGAPVEDHADGEETRWEYIGADGGPSGQTYGIPFGCLCPVDLDNLLVAGPLPLRDARRPRVRALDGPVHGDGPGRGHRGGARHRSRRPTRRAWTPARCASGSRRAG